MITIHYIKKALEPYIRSSVNLDMKSITNIDNQKLNVMYSRVSSISQEHNTSLPYQQKNLQDYCKSNRITNNIHISDVDSGAKERKGILEIKRLIELNLIDTIYITKLDRLYRSIVEGSSFIKLCLDNDVSIKTSLETTDTSTSAGMLQIHLLMSIADYERQCIKDRTWTGKVSTFQQGKRSQGNIAFGYSKQGKDIVINDDEKAVITTIFDLYRSLKSLSSVKRRLDRLEYKTKRNKSFTRKSIYNILTNKFYIGLVHLRGEYTNGQHEALVSKNLFTRINNQLSANNKRGY